jgi:uncharacterized protein
MKPNIIYLHGFASSPNSRKAQYFKQRFKNELDINLLIPDLNKPSFERLSLTAMLEHVADVVRVSPPGPVYLIGSSMGGLAALHFVNRYSDGEARRAEVMMLLAPAFDFIENRQRTLGDDGLAHWQRTGWLDIHNNAADEVRRVHWGLYEDIARYDSYAVNLVIPTLIYHGKHDASVPVSQSERFAVSRGNVSLKVVDSDHGLLDQLDVMWANMLKFFAL